MEVHISHRPELEFKDQQYIKCIKYLVCEK